MVSTGDPGSPCEVEGYSSAQWCLHGAQCVKGTEMQTCSTRRRRFSEASAPLKKCPYHRGNNVQEHRQTAARAKRYRNSEAGKASVARSLHRQKTDENVKQTRRLEEDLNWESMASVATDANRKGLQSATATNSTPATAKTQCGSSNRESATAFASCCVFMALAPSQYPGIHRSKVVSNLKLISNRRSQMTGACTGATGVIAVTMYGTLAIASPRLCMIPRCQRHATLLSLPTYSRSGR